MRGRQPHGELIELASRFVAKPIGNSDQATFYRELKHHCATHGYKPGWVAQKFKEKFGHWPNGLEHLTPLPPSASTLRWICSRQIAYAKAMKASSWR